MAYLEQLLSAISINQSELDKTFGIIGNNAVNTEYLFSLNEMLYNRSNEFNFCNNFIFDEKEVIEHPLKHRLDFAYESFDVNLDIFIEDFNDLFTKDMIVNFRIPLFFKNIWVDPATYALSLTFHTQFYFERKSDHLEFQMTHNS